MNGVCIRCRYPLLNALTEAATSYTAAEIQDWALSGRREEEQDSNASQQDPRLGTFRPMP
jgi:hypothetical protein